MAATVRTPVYRTCVVLAPDSLVSPPIARSIQMVSNAFSILHVSSYRIVLEQTLPSKKPQDFPSYMWFIRQLLARSRIGSSPSLSFVISITTSLIRFPVFPAYRAFLGHLAAYRMMPTRLPLAALVPLPRNLSPSSLASSSPEAPAPTIHRTRSYHVSDWTEDISLRLGNPLLSVVYTCRVPLSTWCPPLYRAPLGYRDFDWTV